MAPLEVNQSTHISADVRLDESTTEQINRYAALIHTCAGDVVCKALNCCLRERPRPLNILQALHVEQVASMLCLRKDASNYVKDAAEHPARRLASGVPAEGSVGVARALGPAFQFRGGARTVLRTGRNVDTSPPSWELRSAKEGSGVYAG